MEDIIHNTRQISGASNRKLGDEWVDWDGDPKEAEVEIHETSKTFLFLATAIISLGIASLPIIWYMIEPRMNQYSIHVSEFIKWMLSGFVVIFLLTSLAESICIFKFKRSFLPYNVVEKFLLSLLPKTVWLGERFGISRDRVGNSFIKLNNNITLSHSKQLSHERPLVLLPRCLGKEARSQIVDTIKEHGTTLKVLTVHGGEEARKAIREYNPSLILALACERDLMSGLKDIGKIIPVLAIPNKRPEGPCRNTKISIDDFKEALAFLLNQKS